MSLTEALEQRLQMTNVLKILKSFLPAIESQSERDEAYMAASADMQDLERRMRQIDNRGRGDGSPVSHGLFTR